MDFTCFPVELHLQILSFMDPEDVLALRKTSRQFRSLTHDPRIWTTMYYRMRRTHSFACSQSEFAALAPWQSERLLVQASKTQKVFQTPRQHAQHQIFPRGQTRKIGSLIALSFLSERFLLSVDDTTVVYVWDIAKLASSAEAPAFPCARLTLVDWTFLTYSMSIDYSTLYVALSKHARTHIFSLSLPMTTSDTDEPKLAFRDVAYFGTLFRRVYSIDPDSCLALLQISEDEIEVLNWCTGSRSSILLHQDVTGTHILRNYFTAMRVCGPYVLCFRWRSIDAYPIPPEFLKRDPATEQPLPVLRRTMLGMVFLTTPMLSRVCCCHSLSGGDVYTISALARDERRGTYHYQAHVHVPLSGAPALTVTLLGVDHAHTDRRVSAWDLGLSGQRGVWVLWPDNRGERHVVAFTTPPSYQDASEHQGAFSESFQAATLSDAGEFILPPEIAPHFQERTIFVVSSWNSGVSEFTGGIALGSLNGAITLV